MSGKAGQARTREFQRRLLGWYRRHRRTLPWRSSPTPYRVWVSEIMLQQTQVRTVLPYYERFLARFPDVESLAAAEEEEILEMWAGLGYYSRARNLRRAAIMIAGDLAGKFPHTLEGILRLPGVGRYTAGAIYSIAFDKAAPIVDGNIRRVIRRFHGFKGRPEEAFFWEQATAWTPKNHASDFNQAVMELGALVCLPAKPLCPGCPVRSVCDAYRNGMDDLRLARRPSRTAEAVELVVLVLECEQAVLLSRMSTARYIPGDWGLPTAELAPGGSPMRTARSLSRRMLRRPVPLRALSPIRHAITHRRILAHLFHAEIADRPVPSGKGDTIAWVRGPQIGRYVTSSLFRKALRRNAKESAGLGRKIPER